MAGFDGNHLIAKQSQLLESKASPYSTMSLANQGKTMGNRKAAGKSHSIPS